MPRKADTHIRVTEETWSRLNRLKGPGDSFNDVIEALLVREEDGDGPEGERLRAR
jgi:predicted CopG family antitoxin